MALLALWHVTYDGGEHDLTYTFREPYVGTVQVSAEDSSGGPPWTPDYIQDRRKYGGVGDSELYAITVTPAEDWVYPVKIKIRSV